ncbi:DUF3231 family protein [Bacillus sp. KH172YL63]|uniref:DUF3231 family protein n=1 Tax=Bacillus sp. KH172YL63 TaxID=2709784 RepID=UPI0013E41A14|nr:DUF3231 family protein [Bacillus sp. KH172YL63]BCB05140.1 hypothetical protein KH172YL63_32730 [Bacillus sp. KH172YL63]
MNKNPLSSSEIGSLWLTYQEKTLILRMLEYFIEKSDDQEARNILGGLWQELDNYVLLLEKIFENEGVPIPVGFKEDDVFLDAPKLYDHGFDIMFVRVLKEVSMGMYTMSINMAYRSDVMTLFEGLTSVTQKIYKLATLYLLKRGILTLPPNVTRAKANQFVKEKDYLSGFHLFSEERPLNDIELGYLHHAIEANNIGFQLITGFAQCATNKDVQKYFVKGQELAKKQIKLFESILLESDIQFSATSGSTVTNSQVPPFSDKLMMYCVYLLNGFGIVGNSFGSIFSLRNDISMKTAMVTSDIFTYGKEGVKLMVKNGWLEQPPQMVDKNKLIGK